MMPKARIFFAIAMITALVSPTKAADRVEFNYRLPQVGDRSSNVVNYDFNLNIALLKSGQTVSENHEIKSRTVERDVTVLESTGDRAVKVAVRYGQVTVQSPAETQPDSDTA